MKEAAITQPDTVHFFESKPDLDTYLPSENLSSTYHLVADPLRIALLGYRSDPYSGGQGVLHYLSSSC